jgi:hypothetical protein
LTPKTKAETVDLESAATRALTRFEILHATESIPTPNGPLPTGRPGDSKDMVKSAKEFVKIKLTEFEFMKGDRSFTEHSAEGAVCCSTGENGKPDNEIKDIDWPVKGTMNVTVIETPVFSII